MWWLVAAEVGNHQLPQNHGLGRRGLLVHFRLGVLRPLDAIQAYRLEMGSKLKTRRGGNLYDYWRDSLSKALNAQAEATGSGSVPQTSSEV